MLRFYRNSWRKAYMNSFDKCATELIKTMDCIKFKKSQCGRFYTSTDSILIRPDLKVASYLGKKNYLGKNLEDMMKYYNDKKYHTIRIDIYDDYKNPKVNMVDDVKNYIENIKLIRVQGVL